MNNQTINEIKKREIDKIYFSFSILSQEIYFNYGNDYIKKRTIYIIYGCSINGIRKYITSIFEDEYTKTSEWYDLLLSLKSRGLEHIFFVCAPHNNVIKSAFDLAFNKVTYFYSCLNLVKKMKHYTSYSYSNDILSKVGSIYLTNNSNEFSLKKDELLEAYSSAPFVTDMIEADLNTFFPFLDYPLFLRKHIISLHFTREFLKKLSRISHSQYSFSSLNEFESKLVPHIKVFECRMYCSKKEWNSIISYLYKDHKDLLLCVL